MCGIATLFSYGGARPDTAKALARACDRMEARGPDGSGVWTTHGGAVGLGHRRLAIIELGPGGAQPMALDDLPLAVAFNGEIYNHVELRRGLEAQGHRFRSSSDTEVLLRLYAEHGPCFAERLRGMFAFALWDGRADGLLLGRDPYGIKPLYVADDGRTFRATSQVQALLAMGGVDMAPEPAGHAGFFLWGSVPEPFTLYRGVRAFPPGHTQWIGPDGPQPPRAFTTVTGLLRQAEAEATAPTDPDEAVREALLDTVRAHLVADVEVGVFLSAGRDSTTLAALATEAGGRLRSVTLGFDEYAGTAEDEVPLAEAAARHYGTDHRTVRVGRAEFAGLADGFFEAMDQPTLDGLNTYLVSRAAAESGLKVVLSGLGGDELFGGYPSFAEVPRLARAVGRLPGHRAVGRGLRAAAAPVLRRVTSPKAAGLIEYGGTVAGAYLLRRALFMPYELGSVLDPDLARAGLEVLDPLGMLGEMSEGLASDRLRVTALESAQYMRSQLLRDSDWASMAHSLELRVPFVDAELLRRVAPLVAACPDRVTKATLARAARPPLPTAIADRPKTGFTTPVRDWLAQTMDAAPAGRGLRGWAQVVYHRMTSPP
ncbi:asparagine synthase (glutamine-hydrolyzing) [Rubrivirga sp.]|uniref:asparagine synthase (glutamine-hydrolyzing) n=1 Tax=Rubrivirga sp. TaxID=1885344 RepID=UPI003B5250AF